MKIEKIDYLSPIEASDPENDNIDVHVHLDDGRVYSFVVATPNNIFWCMANEETDYFFGYPPPVFVNRLTNETIHRAFEAMLCEKGEKWLSLYGVLQTASILV